jgi:hypothetical protein
MWTSLSSWRRSSLGALVQLGSLERSPGALAFRGKGGAIEPVPARRRGLRAGLEAAVATLTHKTWAGEHTEEDWDSHWRSYLGFYADALSTRES